MEVITSHINIDFDGFASMIAVKKLYPNAVLVLPNVVSKEVRNFLALYKGSFELREFREIELNSITKLIIVDTSSMTRVSDFSQAINNSTVQTIVYDHHTEEENNIPSVQSSIRKTGSCTSILLAEIMDRGIEIKPFEATILALGIYSDTNCLTFSSTTVKDAKAVAYLIEKGAYLDVVAEFVGQPLSQKQQNAFEIMARHMESHFVKGLDIGISLVKFEEYIDEIAYLTTRILSLKDYDAVFTLALMRNRIYIIGRSTVPQINIDKIVNEFNGAGHPKAGSAVTKETILEDVRDKLVSILEQKIEPSLTAKDIMNYPVKTVTDDITLKEVNSIMLRYGHTGLPVVKDGELIGMITRRDIEKATIHGYGHSPVKAYMSRKVVSINPDTPIREIQHKFMEHNIGRLPVIDDGALKGIVTRTDILKQTYGVNSPSWYQKIYVENGEQRKKNYSAELNILPKRIRQLLNTAKNIGDDKGFGVYVVGGFVRDLLLGVENLDIDIVVVGDAIAVAKELSSRLGGKIKVHSRFHTAAVEFDDLKIDVVTARREFYEYPAALPTVEKGSIRSDLYRRDFTINSMAISLNNKNFGELIDFFGGQKDLQQGLVRVLYNMSFIEDPTRIFRAIRFEQRYGLRIEEQTFDFMLQAVNSGVVNELSNERITDEIVLMLKENDAHKVVSRALEIGLFKKLFPELQLNNEVIADLEKIKYDNTENLDKLLFKFITLFKNTSHDEAYNTFEILNLNKIYKDAVIKFINKKEELNAKLNSKNISNYELYTLLNDIPKELLYVLGEADDNIKVNIKKYNKIKGARLFINGQNLKELGLKPGPKYKSILEKVFEAKIDGRVETLEEEIELVKQIISKRID